MRKNNKFSIIIPVYNEERFLKKSIDSLVEEINRDKFLSFFKYEILLIDNGSSDDSLKTCEDLGRKYDFFKVYHLHQTSYGQAIKKGILEAKHFSLVIFNVDYWDIDFLKIALSLIDKCDIVIGSKTLVSSGDQRPWHRRQITYFFNAFLKIFLNFPGSDTHGIKVMKRKKVIPLTSHIYSQNELFDTELILKASKQNFVLTELPVDVKEVRPSRYNNSKRIYNTLKDLFIIFKFKYLNGFLNRR